VNLLLDEMFDAEIASALNVLAYRHRCIYSAIKTLGPRTQDPDIPRLCRERLMGCLVTANVRDFGAKLALYEALMAEGVSVVVVRPGKTPLTPEVQLSLLSLNVIRIAEHLQNASGCVLLKLDQGGIRERTLQELRDEIEGKQKLP
jgi:hypothetical protein